MDRPRYTTEADIVRLWYKDGMPPIKALLAIARLAEKNALSRIDSLIQQALADRKE